MANNETHLVAVFNDYETARSASAELTNNGFAAEEIQIGASDIPRVQTAGSGSSYSSEREPEHEGGISGFFHRLFGSHSESEQHGHYAEAMRRGHAVLTLTCDEAQADRAAAILNRFDPVDIDRKAAFFRDRGYETYNASAPAYTPEEAEREREQYRGSESAQAGETQTGRSGAERAIPVVEEDLQVGKRVVQRGGVRVYSRVVEEPVEENVTLREERVRVDRRPADRPATEADLRRRDEVIELVETTEEPVVAKTARVVEEVVLGKEASERTETVRDSVRRTDVQVEPIGGDVDREFRSDFRSRFGTEASYNDYGPAYEYGYRMANDTRYKGRNLDDVDEQLRTDYLRNNPASSWDRVKGAVRYGWEKASGKR